MKKTMPLHVQQLLREDKAHKVIEFVKRIVYSAPYTNVIFKENQYLFNAPLVRRNRLASPTKQLPEKYSGSIF